jgi:hypothetical protein
MNKSYSAVVRVLWPREVLRARVGAKARPLGDARVLPAAIRFCALSRCQPCRSATEALLPRRYTYHGIRWVHHDGGAIHPKVARSVCGAAIYGR